MNTKLNTKQNHLPEKRFSAGALFVTVWNNVNIDDSGKESSYRTISFERRYKDKNGEWKSTNSLRLNDIPKATLVLNKAYEYILLKEGSSGESLPEDE